MDLSLTGNVMPGGNGRGQGDARGPEADSLVPMKAHRSVRQILQANLSLLVHQR